MAFDFSTLVTDRTMADVLARNAKGTYNAADLNRVDECLEDLVARLGRMGYAVPWYQRVKLQRSTQPASRLPEGYTEVQYIRSTGTQYVDTGFKPNHNTRVVMDLLYMGNENISNEFGAWNSSNSGAFICLTTGKNNLYPFYGNMSQQVSVDRTMRHIVDMDKNVVKMNGKTMIAFNAATFACVYPLFLCCFNNAGSTENMTSLRIYSCQIYDNGTLIRDYVPCISPAGAVGLYDLVDGKFYGNSGTGVFFAGPRRVTLPDGYTQVEHIQSSGKQYVDTGFKPNQDSRVICDFEFTSTTEEQTIFMARQSTSANMFGVFHNTSGWNYCYGAERIKGVTGVSVTDRVKLDCNKEKASVNGSVLSANTATFTAPVNMTLFVRNTNGTLNNYASAKLYACQAYDNGFLARDYIPCTNASGAAGLYDLVGQEFYGNAGTGSFTAGEAVTWPEEPAEELDPYTWYESDVPTASQMAQYRGNVSAVRAVLQLPKGTPEPPGTMEQLTTAGANNIEAVLLAVDLILNHIPAAVRHCGVAVCGSKGVIT